jgi:hypothetical protein
MRKPFVSILVARVIGALAVARFRHSLRGLAATAVFVFKVLPMFPSRPIDWLTPQPLREPVQYLTQRGSVEGECCRPASDGRHPGVILCLGVIPVGYDHPQVARLQEALARAGFASLLYWSPAMRDFQLDPGDIEDLAMAYEWLISQPSVDPVRSGMIGTCVGGAFVLMAAASGRIRNRVSFVAAFAPYASMRSLARDIASATWSRGGTRESWPVDPLSRKAFVHSLTAVLEPAEADRLRDMLAEPGGRLNPNDLSAPGQAIYPLLTGPTTSQAEEALRRLPQELGARLDSMSPLRYLQDIDAPLIVLMHDRDDPVIPASESECLWERFNDRAGLHYSQFVMFKHLDPTKVHLHLLPLLRELGRFFRALYPVFRKAA